MPHRQKGARQGMDSVTLLSRTVWWVLYGITLFDFVMNVICQSRKDAFIMNIICLALASHRLAYPPGGA